MLRPPPGGGSPGSGVPASGGQHPEILIEPSSLPLSGYNGNGPSNGSANQVPRSTTPPPPVAPARRNTNASETANGGPRRPISSISLSIRQPLISTGQAPKV